MTTKRALLVGIDHYQHDYIRELKGCVNDVKLMQDVLQTQFNFATQNIRILTNETATRNGILTALDELGRSAQQNDIVVFYYSGHGSQMTDLEGDEADGKDETLVTHDSGRTMRNDENRDIKDDEIALFIKQVNEKTSYVTLIIDSCHSGTMARDVFGDADRWVEEDVVSADHPDYAQHIALLPPPANISDDTREIGGSGWLPKSEKYVLLAGCRDEERAYEFAATAQTRHGIFTYNLCKELRVALPGTSYRTVFERASATVTAKKPGQHPQMEGARNRELFGERTIAAMRYIGVGGKKWGKVTLRGGAAHGLTVGSQWAIYAPEINDILEDTPRLGLVEITNVRAVSADAKILSGSPGAIVAGCRAVEYAHNYGEMRLLVRIEPLSEAHTEQVERLKHLITDSPLMRLATENETPDCNIYLLPPRAEQGGYVPQLGALDEATWAVVTRDGQHQPPHAASDAQAIFFVAQNLEKLARFRIAWGVQNAIIDNPLIGVVQTTIKRRRGFSDWENFSADLPAPTFLEGDLLGMTIANCSAKQSVYVTVLNFGVSGAVNQLHPIEGASEELKPGNQVSFGVEEDDQIPVFFPEDFNGDAADDRLKIIVTSHPADFSHLVQDGWRDVPQTYLEQGAESPIEALMTTALTGTGQRDAYRAWRPKLEHWITEERQYTLLRSLDNE